MKAKTTPGRPMAILQRGLARNIAIAEVARDLGLDVQRLYADKPCSAEALGRIEAYIAARENAESRAP